jgi:glycosyltransferase involved in cell wall biosynthesis
LQKKRLLIVYYATFGSTGAYLNDLLVALSQQNLLVVDTAVSAYYQFPTPPGTSRILKVFFPITEKVPQNKHLHSRVIVYFRKPIRYIELLLTYVWLLGYIVRERITTINLHPIDDYLVTWLFFLTLKYLRREVYVTAHDLHSQNSTITPKRRYALFQKADRIIAHNQHSQTALIEEFNINPQRIFLLSYPLYDFRSILSEKEIRRHEQALRTTVGERRAFLFAGWIRKQKGIDLLIDAWNLAMKDKVDCCLFIVGEPSIPLDDLIEKSLLCPNVYWVPCRVSDEELIAYLRLSDILVMPYRQYANSSLLRAAYVNAQTAVLASNIPLFSEQIGTTEAFFFKNEDVDDLARALQEIRSVPQERLRQMGQQGCFQLQQKGASFTTEVTQAYR